MIGQVAGSPTGDRGVEPRSSGSKPDGYSAFLIPSMPPYASESLFHRGDLLLRNLLKLSS